MTRRWLALASGLVLSSSLVVTAASAKTPRQPLAERMSAVRQWFGRRRRTIGVAARSRVSRTKAAIGPRRTQRFQRARPQRVAAIAARTRCRPTRPHRGPTALPGLGGSPLPRSGQDDRANSAAANGSHVATVPARNQRRKRCANAESRREQSAGTTRVRQLDISAAERQPPAAKSGDERRPARQSPVRRRAPHVTPDDLRRELSGSFPTEPARANQRRTARADERTITPGNSPTARTKRRRRRTAADASPSDRTVERRSGQIGRTRRSIRQPNVRPDDSEPQNAAEAFGANRSASNIGKQFRPHAVRQPLPPAPQSPARQRSLRRSAAGRQRRRSERARLESNADHHHRYPRPEADPRRSRSHVPRAAAKPRRQSRPKASWPPFAFPTGPTSSNTTATQGMVQQSQDAQPTGQLQWQLARLDTPRRRNARGATRAARQPAARARRHLDAWHRSARGPSSKCRNRSCNSRSPARTKCSIDKPQVFKLTITNPGTGPAENVKIDLMPPGGGEETAGPSRAIRSATSRPAPAKTVEVELTPREAGKLFVKAAAVGRRRTDVRRLEGNLLPQAGAGSRLARSRRRSTPARWPRISSASATRAPPRPRTSRVRVSLPEGAEFTSASEGQMFDTKRREVAWHVGTLGPGDDNYMELKCMLKIAGRESIEDHRRHRRRRSHRQQNGRDQRRRAGRFEARRERSERPGRRRQPEAVYEIHVKNRGASAAKDVNVVALFSDGIEPDQAEGAHVHRGRRPRVVPHDRRAAGRAATSCCEFVPTPSQPGTHVFRAEVLCRDLEIKLAAEETTRFYADDVRPTHGKSEKQATSRSEAFQSTVR